MTDPVDERAALALRCEQASGQDRELDCLIAVAVDWKWDDWEEGEITARQMVERHGVDWLVSRARQGVTTMWRYLPSYTASLDAAMTLVPDGWNWGVWMRHDWREQNAQVWHPARDASTLHGYAATPALALCAASLRAHLIAKDQTHD